MHLAAVVSLIALSLVSAVPIERAGVDYYDPRLRGGSQLDKSAGLGEPLNVNFGLLLTSANVC